MCRTNLNPVDDVPQRVRRGQRPPRRHLHEQQTGDDGDVAEAVQQEAPALADSREQHARDRRADGSRAVDDRRVEGDGVGEVFFADHLDDERLARRHVEGVDDAEQRGQGEHVPHLDAAGEDQRRENQRKDHRRGLRRDEDVTAVEAVGRRAAEGREKQDRDLARESGEAEKRRRTSQAVDQPRLCDLLHPRADERDELSGEEEAVVAVTKCAGETRHRYAILQPDAPYRFACQFFQSEKYRLRILVVWIGDADVERRARCHGVPRHLGARGGILRDRVPANGRPDDGDDVRSVSRPHASGRSMAGAVAGQPDHAVAARRVARVRRRDGDAAARGATGSRQRAGRRRRPAGGRVSVCVRPWPQRRGRDVSAVCARRLLWFSSADVDCRRALWRCRDGDNSDGHSHSARHSRGSASGTRARVARG